MRKPRIGQHPRLALPGATCLYSGCQNQRVTIDRLERRHCEGHHIQISAA